jgi:hypothetical protein
LTDNEIYTLVAGKYRHLPQAEAIKAVANELQVTVSGVRGRVSRAQRTVSGQMAVMHYLSQQNTHMISQAQINSMVTEAQKELQERAALLRGLSYYAVYIPDMHVPKQDSRGVQIVYEMIDTLTPVGAVSVLNDGFDFTRLSRWTSRRTVLDNEQDIANSLQIYAHHLDTLRLVAPQALLLPVVGNHDIRVLNDDGNGTGLYTAYQIMQQLAKHGVLWISDLSAQNVVMIHPGLLWAHGYRAMADRRNSARKNYDDIMRIVAAHDTKSPRTMPDLIIGHTHALMQTTTSFGATIYNAGCLCDLQPDYMRKLPDWQHGFVISRIVPDGHDTRLIAIRRTGNKLAALNPFTGMTHEVKL